MKIKNALLVSLMLFNYVFYAQKSKVDFSVEYKKVMNHFSTEAHLLKVKAAQFLLENMFIHKSVLAQWQNSKGEFIEFDETSFPDFQSAKVKVDELKKGGNKRILETQWDQKHISSEFLIDAIDTAFKNWEESPWKDSYSFKTFCEYVLPYRNAIEPVNFGWREEANMGYKTVLQSADDPSDPTSVCSALIYELELIDFKLTRDNPQPLLSIEEMNFRKEGSCPDLANNVLLIARSLGVPTTYDYTPFHGASSNAHFWNTVINKEGVHIPFNGNQNKPYDYDTSTRRIGKALRMTFSNQSSALVNNFPVELIAEKSLSLPNTIDVTDEYVNAYTINFKYAQKSIGGLGYICVYNKGQWRPIWWGKTDDENNVQFTKMGSNLIYLPASVQKTEKEGYRLNYERYPVFLDGKGECHLLKPNFKEKFKCKLSRQNETVFGEREFNTLEMENGSILDLQYWDNGWQPLGKYTVKNQSILVKKIPKNALFRLLPEAPDGFERIFTVQNDSYRVLWY